MFDLAAATDRIARLVNDPDTVVVRIVLNDGSYCSIAMEDEQSFQITHLTEGRLILDELRLAGPSFTPAVIASIIAAL